MIVRLQVSDRKAWLELRKQDVTASDVAALFGAHPYKTALAVYADKIGAGGDDKDSVPLRRGRLLEDAVAKAVAEERPEWEIEKATEYLRDPDDRIGATPDFWVRHVQRLGVLQTKTVSPGNFLKYWGEDPPLYVILQNATEMMLAGVEWGVIAVLVVDGWHFDLHIYEIECRHASAEEKIRAAVRKFWADLEQGIQPSADFERDGSVIAMLQPNEIPGKVIDLSHDNELPALIAERAELAEIIKPAEARKKTVDNQIKAKLGDAECATLPGWKLTYKTRAGYTAVVKPSRVLNVREAKGRA